MIPCTRSQMFDAIGYASCVAQKHHELEVHSITMIQHY